KRICDYFDVLDVFTKVTTICMIVYKLETTRCEITKTCTGPTNRVSTIVQQSATNNRQMFIA
ncbi:hypothetical protein ABEB36_004247, partial [Hypothenemus hampei]